MRVISGKVRGLKLNCPSGIETRPTLDRVKEAVFSMLLPYINEASVLDLFAGSGSLGIEALSRGAERAFFIDNNNDAIKCIKNNISSAHFDSVSTVLKSDAEYFLENTTEKFDIIFLDPPYSDDKYAAIIRLISDFNILSEDGIIVVEWDTEIGFTDQLEKFSVIKNKKYGRVGVTVLK